MPNQDEAFIKRLKATFRVEAEEHLQAMSSMLMELEKSLATSAPNMPVIENVFRGAHSLKGAARAVEESGVEAICQALESVFASWKRESSAPSLEALDTLHNALTSIREMLAVTESGQTAPDRRPQDQLIQTLGRLLTRDASVVQEIALPPRDLTPIEPPPRESPPRESPAGRPAEPEKTPAAETVRIPIAKLDSRLLQAEDMLVVKSLAARQARDLREMCARFEPWHKTWIKVSAQARSLRQKLENPGNDTAQPTAALPELVNFLDWNCDFVRALENKLVSLAEQAAQDRHGVARRVDDLLEDSKKLLMLPFSTLSAVFPQVVRGLCRDQDKEADVIVQGGDVEIDKRILEEMKDPLIHILRNSVDHGVEKSAERTRLGKPARATITIAVSPIDGSKVEILVSDDGEGVDLERLKTAAVRQGAISATEAASLGDAETLELIFRSGVSTSPIVTSISGRGLGMAIVRASTDKLGGQVSIQSKRHVGSTLRITLPLTLATFRGILVSAADRLFVIPMISVERVLRVKAAEIRTVENRETISLEGRPVSLARLDAVLELSPKATRGENSDVISLLILRSTEHRIAFAVDEVLREEEVLVKPLRRPLVRVRNVAGATVLGSGAAVPILNVSDLMKSAMTRGAAAPQTIAANSKQLAPQKRILVVEDSITSRMLLTGILESAGYQVKTAVDGMDGFTALRENSFDLVVSDVEMPRLNGFDLTSRIRADKRLAELPVVLVTALESRGERERGIDAGASAYIVKSSFDQSDLLEVVQRLV